MLIARRDDGDEGCRALDAVVNSLIPVVPGADSGRILPNGHCEAKAPGHFLVKRLHKGANPTRVLIVRIADEEIVREPRNESRHSNGRRRPSLYQTPFMSEADRLASRSLRVLQTPRSFRPPGRRARKSSRSADHASR